MKAELTSLLPSLLTDLWRPGPGGLWLGQDFGNQTFLANHPKSLSDFLDRIVDNAEEIYNNKVLDICAKFGREKTILEERLKDALVNYEPPSPQPVAPALFVPPVVDEHIQLCPTSSAVQQEQAAGRAVRSEADDHNGVTPPKSGVTERLWRIADKITALAASEGRPPASREQVVAVAKMENIKESTAASSYSAWAKYNNINPKDPSKPFEAKKAKEAKPETLQPAPTEGISLPPPPLPAWTPPPPLPPC